MAVKTSENGGPYEFPTIVTHVQNGEPANQAVLRAPSIDLENRTDALKDHAEYFEELRTLQIGEGPTAPYSGQGHELPASPDSDNASIMIGGAQGNFNAAHQHSGGINDGALIDFQQIYDNDEASGVAEFRLNTGGSFAILDSASPTPNTLFKVNENGDIQISGTGLVPDSVDAEAIDFGPGANQVNMDNMVEATSPTNAVITKAKESSYDTHLTQDASTAHNASLIVRFIKKNEVFFSTQYITTNPADNFSSELDAELSGETPGGDESNEGVGTETSSAFNIVALRDTNTNSPIEDTVTGNRVYGRLTHNGTYWRLDFATTSSGAEVAATVPGGSPALLMYIQKVFNVSNVPTANDLVYLLAQ